MHKWICILVLMFSFNHVQAQDNSGGDEATSQSEAADNVDEAEASDAEPADKEDSGKDDEGSEDKGDNSGAEADAPSPGADHNVKWYFPELRKSDKPKMVKVMISGSSTPAAAQVYIGSKSIPVIRKGKVRKMPRSKAFVSREQAKVKTNENGLFVYPVNLPTGQVRLPIRVKFADGFTQNYQLNLSVRADEVKLTNQANLTRSPAFAKPYEVWGGVGFNYVRYDQESTDIQSDLLFESFKLPSLFLKGRAHVYGDWDALYTFKLSPGETTSGTSVTVNQGAYDWQTHTLEAKWTPPNWRTKVFKNEGQWSLRMGAQHHIVPFIVRESTTTANIETNTVTMASLGGQYQEIITNNWDFEFYMRVQHPLAAGDEFGIVSNFAFDGSLGMIYNYPGGLRLGVFWYGQLQTYDYTTNDLVLDAEIEGKQTLFYSNIDVRLGYAFD